jgi:uncharacterized protein involved in response to NO
MSINHKFFERPYSLLFLFGLLSSVLGVSIWGMVFSGIHYWEDPLTIHKTMMFGLFMFSFIEGFLFTALPNFTKGQRPSAKFYHLILFFKFAQLIGFFIDSYNVMLVFLISDLLALIVFIFIQYQKKKSNPPPSFIFVVLGISYGLLYFTLEWIAPVHNQALLLEYGFILNIILGVGLKIIPVLLGRVESSPAFVLEKKRKSFFDLIKKHEHFLFLGLINLALVIQLLGQFFAGSLLMTAALLGLFHRKLQVFKLPKNRTLVTYGIWIALWSIITGTLLSGMESFTIFGRHIFFISGIALLTIMIASRVTLSHGGHGLQLESSSKSLGAVVALAVLSAMLRFLPAVLDFLTYEHALFCAAILWVLSNIIWVITFGKKIYQPG